MPHPEVPSSYAPQPPQPPGQQPLYFPGPMPYAGWAYPQQPPAGAPAPAAQRPPNLFAVVGYTAAAAMFLGASVTAGYVYGLPQHQANRQVHQQAQQFERIQEISCPTGGFSNAF